MEKATLLNIENHMGTSLVNDLINGPCLRLVEQLIALIGELWLLDNRINKKE